MIDISGKSPSTAPRLGATTAVSAMSNAQLQRSTSRMSVWAPLPLPTTAFAIAWRTGAMGNLRITTTACIFCASSAWHPDMALPEYKYAAVSPLMPDDITDEQLFNMDRWARDGDRAVFNSAFAPGAERPRIIRPRPDFDNPAIDLETMDDAEIFGFATRD